MRFVNSGVQSRSKNSTFPGSELGDGMSGNGCIVGDRLQASCLMVLELQGYSHASSGLVK